MPETFFRTSVVGPDSESTVDLFSGVSVTYQTMLMSGCAFRSSSGVNSLSLVCRAAETTKFTGADQRFCAFQVNAGSGIGDLGAQDGCAGFNSFQEWCVELAGIGATQVLALADVPTGIAGHCGISRWAVMSDMGPSSVPLLVPVCLFEGLRAVVDFLRKVIRFEKLQDESTFARLPSAHHSTNLMTRPRTAWHLPFTVSREMGGAEVHLYLQSKTENHFDSKTQAPSSTCKAQSRSSPCEPSQTTTSMHGQHRAVSTTSEDDEKGHSEPTNEPSPSTLHPVKSVWWSAMWELNRAIYHMSGDPEADVKIERLKRKSAVHRVEEVYRGICEKYGFNPAAGTSVTNSFGHRITQEGTETVAFQIEP